MTILLEDSVCKDCKWTVSCMIFKKINGIVDNRTFVDNSNHRNDIIEIIVKKCSYKIWIDHIELEKKRTGDNMNNNINVAVVGVGNCCSSLIQGLEYYKNITDNEK